VKLRAEFANADEALFPNQFVNVQLVVDQLEGVTTVPTAAIQRGTVGTYVYVVVDGKTVSIRTIETGSTERGQVEVTKGLKPGEVVVVDGVDKLKEGAQVELVTRNTGAPAAKKPHGKAGARKPADGAAPAAAPAKN
jgi:multidrug efflux system membrane fusion protein